MRIASSLILVIAVFFGLHARVLATHSCEQIATMTQADHCHHHHNENLPSHSSEEKDGPVDHHHHCGLVCHTSPLVSDTDLMSLLISPSSIRLRLSLESELIPEGPYLSSAKPPII